MKDFPRPGSAEYDFLFGDESQEKKVLRRWKAMNKFFTIPLYRIGILPLFGMGKVFLLLFTKGKKTGKKRVTPVEYRRKNGEIYVVAGRGGKAHWFKNLIAHPDDIYVKIGFKKFSAKFELIDDVETKNQFFIWYVTKFPSAAKYLFGWDKKKDNVEVVDFTSFSALVKLLKIEKK